MASAIVFISNVECLSETPHDNNFVFIIQSLLKSTKYLFTALIFHLFDIIFSEFFQISLRRISEALKPFHITFKSEINLPTNHILFSYHAHFIIAVFSLELSLFKSLIVFTCLFQIFIPLLFNACCTLSTASLNDSKSIFVLSLLYIVFWFLNLTT